MARTRKQKQPKTHMTVVEQEQLEERIAEMRFTLHMSIKEMAEGLKVSYGTVCHYLKRVEAKMSKAITPEMWQKCINAVTYRYDQLSKKCFRGLTRVEPGTREYFVAILAGAELNAKIERHLQALGIMPTAPTTVNVESNSVVEHRLPPEALALAERTMLRSPVKELPPESVTVEFK